MRSIELTIPWPIFFCSAVSNLGVESDFQFLVWTVDILGSQQHMNQDESVLQMLYLFELCIRSLSLL